MGETPGVSMNLPCEFLNIQVQKELWPHLSTAPAFSFPCPCLLRRGCLNPDVFFFQYQPQ